MSGAVQALIGSLKAAAAGGDPNWSSVTLLLPGNGTNGAQNNTFIDGSTNNFTITRNGNTTQGTFSPFSITPPYSTSTRGGSGYFDGTGDYLDIASAATLTPSGDFTIEFWAYPTQFVRNPGNIIIFYSKGYGIQVYTSNGTWGAAYSSANNGTYYINNTFGSGTLSGWQHVAVYRSGNNYYGALDGVVTLLGTSSSAPNTGSDPVRVGDFSGGVQYPAIGYISSVRYVNGTAVYGASNFTPSTTPLTAITNTSLLLNFTNAAIIDNAMLNDLETVGNAQISTAQSKFGGSSMYFDGTGDNLTIQPANAGITLGSGDFTLEMWAYFNNFTNTPTLFDQRPAATNGAYPLLYIDASNQPIWYVSSAARITGSALSTSTWYHIAVARSGTSTKMFVDGVQVGSTYTDSTNYLNGFTAIGSASFTANYYLNGYIDDLRITKGVARYTANFTPPTSAFPTS